MRKTLENSREQWVSLEKEWQALQLYLELEQRRFGPGLHVHIHLEEELRDQHPLVPSMFIQPFLENAIWHGLKPKQAPGDLWLRIYRDGEFLICLIEDNGIGRARSEVMKRPSQKAHRSVAISNIRERMYLLNKLYNGQITMSIEDRDRNPDTGATGTRVVLRISLRLMKRKRRSAISEK